MRLTPFHINTGGTYAVLTAAQIEGQPTFPRLKATLLRVVSGRRGGGATPQIMTTKLTRLDGPASEATRVSDRRGPQPAEFASACTEVSANSAKRSTPILIAHRLVPTQENPPSIADASPAPASDAGTAALANHRADKAADVRQVPSPSQASSPTRPASADNFVRTALGRVVEAFTGLKHLLAQAIVRIRRFLRNDSRVAEANVAAGELTIRDITKATLEDIFLKVNDFHENFEEKTHSFAQFREAQDPSSKGGHSLLRTFVSSFKLLGMQNDFSRLGQTGVLAEAESLFASARRTLPAGQDARFQELLKRVSRWGDESAYRDHDYVDSPKAFRQTMTELRQDLGEVLETIDTLWKQTFDAELFGQRPAAASSPDVGEGDNVSHSEVRHSSQKTHEQSVHDDGSSERCSVVSARSGCRAVDVSGSADSASTDWRPAMDPIEPRVEEWIAASVREPRWTRAAENQVVQGRRPEQAKANSGWYLWDEGRGITV